MKIAHIGTSLPDREDRDWVTGNELVNESGVTYRQYDYWCRTGLLLAIDDNTPGSGWTRRFHTDQVTRATTIRDLIGAGIALPVIREVIDTFLTTGSIQLGAFTLTTRDQTGGHAA